VSQTSFLFFIIVKWFWKTSGFRKRLGK